MHVLIFRFEPLFSFGWVWGIQSSKEPLCNHGAPAQLDPRRPLLRRVKAAGAEWSLG